MLSAKHPCGVSSEVLFREALECLLEKKSPSRGPCFAGVVIKDKILKRDGYQCTFIGRENKRCSCKNHLQIDHIIPWAEGGATLEQNLRVLCSSHNKFLAEKRFGVSYKKRRYERL